MQCFKVQSLLSAYLDDELAADVRANAAEHLENCAACSFELQRFKELSEMAGAFETPQPPDDLWNRIESQVAELPKGQPARRSNRRPAWALGVAAVAATVLIAIGIGWLVGKSVFPHDAHAVFAREFGEYLDTFRSDPATAQQMLLAHYQAAPIHPQEAVRHVGYRPMIASGLPEDYTAEKTYVMKMPCCTCVQTICKRRDGSALAIFEHDDEIVADRIGDKPGITTRCGGKECCLVDLNDRIAATWRHGTRRVTLVGVQDLAEVNQLVAWMDAKASEIH